MPESRATVTKIMEKNVFKPKKMEQKGVTLRKITCKMINIAILDGFAKMRFLLRKLLGDSTLLQNRDRELQKQELDKFP
jgi:hypothetical protein